MTAPTTVVTNLPKAALTALLASGTLKAMFVDAAFTPNQDSLDFINDVTNEASGTSYTAGGLAITGAVVNVDTSTNKCTLDADDITTASLSVSCRWVILYVYTGSTSTSPVIAYIDMSQGVGGNVTVTGVQWDSAGIVPFTVA